MRTQVITILAAALIAPAAVSMNALEWFQQNRDVQTVAIVSFPGEYGGDGAAGAKMASEQLGLEVVYDGDGQVTPPSADNPNPDQ